MFNPVRCMIIANIEAAIEAKHKEIVINHGKIIKLDNDIEILKEQQKRLLEKDTELCYELEELKEQLND